MSVAIVYSRASLGIEASLVTIEVHLSAGLPYLSIVGLPEAAIRESKDRVRSALINSGFYFPTRRITINLAPADLPKKEGGRFDLPIALGILIASKQLTITNISQYEFAGELALDGGLRPFIGALPFALSTKKEGRILVLPKENASEAALTKITILSPSHLLDVCNHFSGYKPIIPYEAQIPQTEQASDLDLNLNDVYGQEQAKRALEIAAAGGHSLFMIGPPGVGKTMLANRLNTILPEMTEVEALEAAAINSVCGKLINHRVWRKRSFRSPHHTISDVALVGGSNPPRPGEISLAHNGVLFLDELPEFHRSTLEALREPLESGYVTISRAAHQAKFPAKFHLVVAMNPCPCGYFGDSNSSCNCTKNQIQRYHARISGPFLDRIDIYISLSALPKTILFDKEFRQTTSLEVQKRIIVAREKAYLRAGKINSDLTNKELEKFCKITTKDQNFLEGVFEKLTLSMRSFHRVIKIARTIADIDDSDAIKTSHLKEAVLYRTNCLGSKEV